MSQDRHPFFRKHYIPWYDTTAVCWGCIILLMLIFFFALSGIIVAGSEPDLLDHLWFPGMLGGLCLWVIVKMGVRLWRRNRHE
jgi:hypothetical protein